MSETPSLESSDLPAEDGGGQSNVRAAGDQMELGVGGAIADDEGIGSLDELINDVAAAVVEVEAERKANAPRHKSARQKVIAGTRFVIPARSAAICGAIVALISLVSLVLVAESHSANALATIALALAILSFVIQIMVFIYQSQTANQQMLQAEQLYTETRTLLTEVRTAANSTETLVREQFQDLLKAFMEAAPNNSETGEPLDMELLEQRMVKILRSEQREMSRSTATSDRPPPTAISSRARVIRDSRRREQVSTLLRFPDEEEGKPALAALESLATGGTDRLRRLIQDELEFRRNSAKFLGLPWMPADEELLAAKLITQARVNVGGNRMAVARLTDLGQSAGRFLIATGEVPEYAINKLPDPSTSHPDDAGGDA